MVSLHSLFLESSMRYSTLADELFRESVYWSRKAGNVSAQRLALAKYIVKEGKNIEFELEVSELAADEAFKSCMQLDALLCDLLEKYEDFWPTICGIVAAAKGFQAFEKKRKERITAEVWHCLACGSVNKQKEDFVCTACVVCGSEQNWLVPEN